MDKELISIKNPKHFRILSDLQAIVWHEVAHIPGCANVLADALSRLTRHIRIEETEMAAVKPRILGLSSCRARKARKLIVEDQNLATIGSLDPEYIGLMSLVERRVQPKDLPLD